jgi:transmembrane sensor
MKAEMNDTPDRDEEAAMWCLSLAEGNMNAEERSRFDVWLSDPANAEALNLQAAGWNLVGFSGNRPEIIRMRREALEDYRKASGGRWRRPRRPGYAARWGATAAAVLLAFAGFAAWQSPNFFAPDDAIVATSDRTVTFRTARAQREIASLEDGSRLSLDAASTVDVRMSAGRRDLVLVDGRAAFAVTKAKTPFRVLVGDKMVIATGTHFTVERIGQTVNISLFEGSVDIVERSGVGELKLAQLSPGESLSLPALGSPTAVTPRRSGDSMAWTQGRLEFVDQPLEFAVARLNRYATKPVVLAPDVPQGLRVTGLFEAGDVEAFVRGVAGLHSLAMSESVHEIRLSHR